MLCCCHLEILINFWTGAPHFHFLLSPINFVAYSDYNNGNHSVIFLILTNSQLAVWCSPGNKSKPRPDLEGESLQLRPIWANLLHQSIRDSTNQTSRLYLQSYGVGGWEGHRESLAVVYYFCHYHRISGFYSPPSKRPIVLHLPFPTFSPCSPVRA